MTNKITLEQLDIWLQRNSETENLEFKLAKTFYDPDKLIAYCTAIANELGGYLVLGISESQPRKVTGTQAFGSIAELNNLKKKDCREIRN